MTEKSALQANAPRNDGEGSLKDVQWQPAYSHEDGDLVKLFFIPALTRARLYQRVTGYFTAGVLAMAARGLESLVERDGRMQLVVGCTLGPKEIEQIDEGYKLRDVLATSMAGKMDCILDDPDVRERLGWLSWLVARERLDIKLAVPKDENGRFRDGLGLYHAKSGLLTDADGDRLVYTGSINETVSGWRCNRESFSVSCSWRGEWDLARVEKAALEFDRLWKNEARFTEVLDFPEALREKLLQYLPEDVSSGKSPEPRPAPDGKKTEESSKTETGERRGDADEARGRARKDAGKTPVEMEKATGAEPDGPLTSDERMRLVWAFLKNAPKRPDGALIAVKTSTVTPWPHQLRAYGRMLDNWPVRLLIADEVGLGKTIEAGMIIRHVWISELAKRILIMAPKAILGQWQAELYEKFNLLVPIYTGRTLVHPAHHYAAGPLEQKVDRDQWTRTPFVITSSHLMRRTDRRRELMSAADWDLVVLDEAHHARRRGAGSRQEKGPNLLLGLMREMEAKTRSLLLLTATPMQVHPVEIWDLIHLLGIPEAWTAEAFLTYFEMVAQNPDNEELRGLCRLFQAAERYFGPAPEEEIERIADGMGLSRLKRKNVLKVLRESKSLIPFSRLSTLQRKCALAILKAVSPIRHRMSRHTRGLLRQYHRNGLLDTPIAERDVTDLSIALTPGERALYEAVEDYISDTWRKAEPNKKTAVGFVMTIYRRRVASSFYALRRTLENRLARLAGDGLERDDARLDEDAPQDELAEEAPSGEDVADLEDQALVAEERNAIKGLLKSIARLGADSKALRLVEELKQALSEGYDSAIVFTQYTDTMDYLKEFLSDRLDRSMGCFSGAGGARRDHSGAWTPCSREEIKRLLQQGAFHILVCTDAAGEGLNLQHCGVLVNYDLPWNPMKVEQRIGRIDRIGQKHPVVRVINMAYEDTVEADVYFALSERIGLFQGVVGKLQPILAQIPREFEAAVLAPREQREKCRHEALSHVQRLVDDTEEAGFDIDEVSEADLAPPRFPSPPFEPEAMDEIMTREELLPAGVECRKLDASTYALRLPGRTEEARVTTSPGVFDDHFESHQLLFPDSPLFNQLYDASGAEAVEGGWEDVDALQGLL